MKSSGYQIKKLIEIALPILTAQVIQTLMGFVDTVMAGRISAVDLAAVAVGNSIWLPVIIVIGGSIMAVPAMVSHLNGANKDNEIRPLIHQTMYMALVCSVIAMISFANADFVLNKMDIEPELAHLAAEYLQALLWGVPAFLLFQTLRSFTEGMSWTVPSMLIGFIGFSVNIPANYIFINGYFGLPPMGGAGCGAASAIVYWCMAISLVIYIACFKRFRHFNLFHNLKKIDFKEQKRLITLGMPIAVAVFLEVALFAFVALMLAPLGPVIVAANQIAINVATITLMLPLSIGVAITIRVGYYLGRGNPEAAKKVAFIGSMIGLIVAGITALLTLTGRTWIAELYSNDTAVTSYAARLLLFCCLYQLPNSIQTTYAASLRGYKDTLPIFRIALISYWGIGMTVGYVAGKTNLLVPHMGPDGFWVGIIVGLIAAAIMLKHRLQQTQYRQVGKNISRNSVSISNTRYIMREDES